LRASRAGSAAPSARSGRRFRPDATQQAAFGSCECGRPCGRRPGLRAHSAKLF